MSAAGADRTARIGAAVHSVRAVPARRAGVDQADAGRPSAARAPQRAARRERTRAWPATAARRPSCCTSTACSAGPTTAVHATHLTDADVPCSARAGPRLLLPHHRTRPGRRHRPGPAASRRRQPAHPRLDQHAVIDPFEEPRGWRCTSGCPAAARPLHANELLAAATSYAAWAGTIGGRDPGGTPRRFRRGRRCFVPDARRRAGPDRLRRDRERTSSGLVGGRLSSSHDSVLITGIGRRPAATGPAPDLLGIQTGRGADRRGRPDRVDRARNAGPRREHPDRSRGSRLIPGFVDSPQPPGLRRRSQRGVRGPDDRTAVRRWRDRGSVRRHPRRRPMMNCAGWSRIGSPSFGAGHDHDRDQERLRADRRGRGALAADRRGVHRRDDVSRSPRGAG